MLFTNILATKLAEGTKVSVFSEGCTNKPVASI